MQPKDKRQRERVERGLYVKDGNYIACASSPNGKTQWRGLGKVGIMEARRLRDAFVAEVRKGTVASGKSKFSEVADEWLAQQDKLKAIGEIRPKTYVAYEGSIRLHVKPFFASRTIQSITPDDLVAWHRKMREDGQSAWSIRKHYMALRLTLGYAARHGLIPANPADALTKREKPKPGPSRLRFLDADEIKALLDKAPKRYRIAIAIALFTGVRLGELRGLRWKDVDLKNGIVFVTGQCDSKGQRNDFPKTAAGHREVVLMEALASMLKAHKLASPFSGPDDFVIASSNRTAINARNLAQRGLDKAAEDAGLEDVTFHVLRHTFVSILIGQGHDPNYIAAQVGHEKPSVTLDTYGHLFNRQRNAQAHRKALDSEFGHLLGSQAT